MPKANKDISNIQIANQNELDFISVAFNKKIKLIFVNKLKFIKSFWRIYYKFKVSKFWWQLLRLQNLVEYCEK